MTQFDTPELVVIGGGIAGAAFATVMARAGHSVLMLEITEQHRDVVRGEWLAPWGVAEAKRLGLYDLYRSHGAHHIKQHITYDEDIPIAEAEAKTLVFGAVMPGDDGPMTLGHPKACGILDDAAVAAGAKFLRGVRKTRVTAGTPPTVAFEHNGVAHEIKPRLVIAADGRHGKTAQQAGLKFNGDPAHHWFSGMLIENIHDWPAETQTVGVANGMNFFVFPQGNGRARLYQGVALADKERFMGEDAPRRFADSFRISCLPNPDAIARGTPASHCFVYPNNDTWAEEPFVPGVVAIGDAAGHNDPIIGQGLSISHRDVRIVTDILKSTRDWTVGALTDYATERRERLRRLRLSGKYMAIRDCEFDAAGRARRKRLHDIGMSNPMTVGLTLATLMGPDAIPAEAFNEQALDALLAA